MLRVSRTSLFGLCSLLIGSIAVAASREGEWPTFRGSDRSATAPDQNLLDSWPEGGPKLLWETEGLGRGYSSLAIADGRIYTMGDNLPDADETDEYLMAFDQKSGALVWKLKTGEAWNNGKESWQSSRSTPSVSGDHVYALTAHGDLYCVSTEGDIVWQRNLKDDFQGKKADSWGYSESVLIDGDHLVVTPGGPENTMVKLDRKTGETIWTTSRDGDRGAGHASTVISHLGDTKVYVTTTGSGAMGVRANDGELLWTYDIERITAVIPTPIVRENLVFFAAGYNNGGGALLRQVVADEGDIQVEEIYGLNGDLKNKHGGIVLVGDHLYGDSDDKGIPFCADLMTGEIAWNKTRSSEGRSSASLIAADGKLFIRFANGVMSLAKATPEGFEELSTFEVPGSGDRPSWSHPVVTDGKLYLREGNKLLCYDVSK